MCARCAGSLRLTARAQDARAHTFVIFFSSSFGRAALLGAGTCTRPCQPPRTPSPGARAAGACSLRRGAKPGMCTPQRPLFRARTVPPSAVAFQPRSFPAHPLLPLLRLRARPPLLVPLVRLPSRPGCRASSFRATLARPRERAFSARLRIRAACGELCASSRPTQQCRSNGRASAREGARLPTPRPLTPRVPPLTEPQGDLRASVAAPRHPSDQGGRCT